MFNYRNHIFYGLLDGTGGLTPVDDETEETSNLPEDDKFWEYVEVEEASQSDSGSHFDVCFRNDPKGTEGLDYICNATLDEVLDALGSRDTPPIPIVGYYTPNDGSLMFSANFVASLVDENEYSYPFALFHVPVSSLTGGTANDDLKLYLTNEGVSLAKPDKDNSGGGGGGDGTAS